MNNLIIEKKSEHKGLRILLDAHSDEVGLIAQHILPSGLIKFLTLGGWDPKNLPAQGFKIKNKNEQKIESVISSIPPHFLSEKEKNTPTTFNQLFLDVGASSDDEVLNNYHINIACPAVPSTDFHFDEKNDIMWGKAFDCRIGCAALIDVLGTLENEALNVDLTATFSTQEEVGVRGISVCTNNIDADLAIVFEGTPADDTFGPDYETQTALKKGPMLRHIDVRMITHPGFQRYAMDIAKENDIPFQDAVRSGGGTNGSVIHLQNRGIPTIVIGVPVRYIHSSIGLCSYQDYQNTVKLALKIIRSMNTKKFQSI